MRVSPALLVLYIAVSYHHVTPINPANQHCVSDPYHATFNCLNYESTYHLTRACDCVVYQSYGLSKGCFQSPNHPEFYPPNINCILYSFIGDSFEFIELQFIAFDLKMPDPSGRCNDFLRIYQNLERPEVNEHSVHDLEFCGGYGSIQNTVYSAGRSMVLEFHSDFRLGRPGNYTGFKGNFQFLDKRNYTTTGTRVDDRSCVYDFHSNSSHTSGRFFSPFYPQNYRPNTACRYRFFGQQGEIVKIVFTNIQLHHIDTSSHYYSCLDSPDVITVYDGMDEKAAILATYCDVHNSEEVISQNNLAVVAFKSDDHYEKQGFAATYVFQNRTPGTRIPKFHKSTNYSYPPCNENHESRNNKSGTISSPNYPEPYSKDIRCEYNFTGSGRERIQLKFLHMDLQYPRGDPTTVVECTTSDDAVTVYVMINGQKEKLNTWCGRKLPPMLMSSQHSMIVEFRSTSSEKTVTGFLAQYSFVSNFGILEGQQDNRGTCSFNYQSSVKQSGEIMSPNYNGLYPRNTECHYLFYGRGNERVHIVFVEFDVDGMTPRCEESTESDYVSFSNFAESEDRKMTRFCGTNSGDTREIWSDGPFFRVIFKSNEIYDSTGFLAHYQFKAEEVEEPGNPDPEQKRTVGNSDRAGYSHTMPVTSLILACLSLCWIQQISLL
ncbi:suppressor of lurcher protein 1-like [Physella acuta]|uniref:suppressor of lurcher protein 1-like n=1 Tax=Physella acuta TaxID=109671 RepID=UPI0027DB1E04|nr:suppressor of lurcher protein 1-like [Physella acuta]